MLAIRRIVLILVTVTCSLCALAQNMIVKGIAVDSLGTPESFATIKLFSLPDTIRPIATAVAKEDGTFSQSLKKAGNYRLTVSSLGKLPATRDFSISAQETTKNLGKIVLRDNNTIGEVVVEATRPLISRQIDRITYDVQGDVESQTSMIDDMLQKVPFVSVDPDGTIKIKGSSGFKIYKNGRPNNAFTNNAKEIFKAMPANMIKRIEVITDPGAREDAEGTGMILNIVTLENTVIKGVLGSVGLSYSTNRYIPSPTTWLTTQIDKVTISVNADIYSTPARGNHQTHYTDRTFESGNESHESTDQKIRSTSGSVGFEASYDIDTLNLITAEFNTFIIGETTRQVFDYGMYNPADELIYGYKAYGLIKPDRSHWLGGSVNYQRLTRRKGEKITASYMISGNGRKHTWLNDYTDMISMPVDYTGIHTKSDATFIEHTAQVDWTRPLTAGQTLDLGVKYINRRNRSIATQDYMETTDIINTDFSHITQVTAAFADYRYNVGNLGLRAGLRYEYSRLEAKFHDGSQPDYHSNLNDWVPNAAISYNINQSNGIRLNYSTSINRPGINYLNPMVNRAPQSVSFGNPDLGSVRNQSLNLEYGYFTRRFNININAGYNFTHNGIIDIKTAEDDITIDTYSNGGRNKSMNAGLYMQWQMTRKTNIMFNGSTNYSHYENPNAGIRAYGWSGSAFLRVSQRLPWNIDLIGNARYWDGSTSLYSIFKPCGASKFNHNLSLQRSFLKENRLSVRIYASCPFGPGKSEFRSHMINVPYLSSSHSITSNNRQFGFNISYRFGKLDAQVKKVRRISNNDMIGGATR